MPRRAKIRPDEPGRDKVLSAGLVLFGERGYHATSIAEIGLRAGIAKSVLYHYFGSKAGLYEEVAVAQTRDLVTAVADAVPADPDAPRLRAGVDAYLAFLAERPAAWRLLLRDPPADSELLKIHKRLARQREQALNRLLTRRAKLGHEQPQAALVGTAIRAFAEWWYDHRDKLAKAFEAAAASGQLRTGSAAKLARERGAGITPTTTIRLDPSDISRARALAAKRGERSKQSLKGASRQMVESMSEQQLREFAHTRRKGLPRKRER